MNQPKHFSRANQDRERSRQLMEKYYKEKQLKATPYPSGFSEYRMRFIAPYAMLIYVFTILFCAGWLITKGNSFLNKIQINSAQTELQSFNIPENNTVYKFIANQDIKAGNNKKRSGLFSQIYAPIYSELEIEFLDKDYNHVYSVYKNLWVEYYERKAYKDTQIDFDIEFQKAGTYFVRIINHNNNTGPVTIETYKTHASLYFFKYFIFFVILNVILFFGNSYWGTTSMLFQSIKKIKAIKNNTKFLLISSLVILAFVGCVIISFTHYGYPSTGDEIRLPTYFFDSKDVLYLG